MKIISSKDFNKILNENIRKHDVPYHGSFELTPLCNLNCKMCYVHLQDTSLKEKVLSKEVWTSIMKDAIDKGMLYAMLTGGEAMTHPGFWDIYMFLINNGIRTKIKTNGLLLNNENIKRFKEFPPYMIDISLYGCDEESYIAVTGVNAYEQVTSNIKNAVNEGLNIRVVVTPSSYMSKWTEKVMLLAKSFGVKVVINNLLIEANDNTRRNKKDYDLSIDDYMEIDKKTKDIFLNALKYTEEDEFKANDNRPDVPTKGLYCNSGRSGFAVSWDGIMSPCLTFPRDIVSSDILKYGFANAWKQVNEEIKKYEVPKKCHTCKINNKCHYCPIQHSKFASKHECDPKICDYWMNMYKDDIK